MDRYARNKGIIDENNQQYLGKITAAIVGLGGLGGHIAEQLARLGFGRLILIDGDKVDATNLNRQLFATEDTLGMPKTEAALKRLGTVNSLIRYTACAERLTAENALDLLRGADIVFDAVDNAATRLVLQSACRKLNIPLVHGAIGGFWGQVCLIMPGDDAIGKLYPAATDGGAEKSYGNPAFTPALIASLQVAEALKYCLRMPGLLHNKLLRIDILSHEYTLLEL